MHRKSLGTSKSTPRLAIMAHRTSSIKTHGMSSLRRPYTSRSSWHDNVASIACSRPNWIITIADALSGNHQVCHTWSHGVWRQHLQILHLVVFQMEEVRKLSTVCAFLLSIFHSQPWMKAKPSTQSVKHVKGKSYSMKLWLRSEGCDCNGGRRLRLEADETERFSSASRPATGSKTISRKSGLSQAHGNRNMWTMHVSIFIYFFSAFPFSIQRGVSPIIMEKQSWDDMWTMHVCIFIYLSLLLFIYLGRREPHDHGKNIMKVFSDT